MSKHRLHARLARVERLASTANGKERDLTRDFPFDPVAAKALRDEHARLWELGCKGDSPSAYGGPLTSADLAEQARLGESIAARGRSFSCPTGYGELQARTDEKRHRFLFFGRRMAHHHGGDRMTKAEDAEEAQVVARLAAYQNSPESHARGRISQLRWKVDARTATEETELEELLKRYPDLPPDPDDPIAAMRKRFMEALESIEEV
jgi:hypothetical protein